MSIEASDIVYRKENQDIKELNSAGKFELNSQSFVSGWSGVGYRVFTNENNETVIEADKLKLRKTFEAYETLIQKIRSGNGSYLFSDGIVALDGIEDLGNNIFRVPIDDEVGQNFQVNDLVKAQSFSENNLYNIEGIVKEIASNSFNLEVINGDAPLEGMSFVRIGNQTDKTRQGSVFISSTPDPVLDVYDGIETLADWSSFNKLKFRAGDISTVTSPTFGNLNGYGLYTQNAYLEGNVNISGNISVGTTFYAGKKTKNVCQYSEGTQGWNSTSNPTVDNTIETPAGTYGCVKFEPEHLIRKDINNNYSFQSNADGVNDYDSFTISFWIKRDAASDPFSIKLDANDVFATSVYEVTTEWQRVVFHFNTHDRLLNTYNFFDINIQESVPGKILYVWGVQVETGSEVTAYQKTEAYTPVDGYGMWTSDAGFGGTMQLPFVVADNEGLRVDLSGNYLARIGNTPVNGKKGFYIGDGTNHLVEFLDDGTNKIAGWSIEGNTISSGELNIQSGTTPKIFVGTGTYNNANTPVYISGDSQFSLGDKLAFNNGALTLSGSITARDGKIGGWDITDEGLFFNIDSSSNYNALWLSATNLDANRYAGFGFYRVEELTPVDEVKCIQIGKLHRLNRIEKESPDYGIEILRKITGGYSHLMRIGGSQALLAGWELTHEKIYSDNIEISATGGIKHSDSFWSLNPDGSGSLAGNKISWSSDGDFLLKSKGRNLLEDTCDLNWVEGANFPNCFDLYGNEEKNRLVMGENPFGSESVLLEGFGSDGSSSGGFYNDGSFRNEADITKTYRFSIFLKRNNIGSNTGNSYLGTYAYNNSAKITVTKIENGSSEDNPYFFAGKLPEADKWYLLVGYLHHADYSGTVNIGGVYDVSTGKKVTEAKDFKFELPTDQFLIRTYYLYNSIEGSKAWFYLPRIDEVNGEEPSITELLGFNDTTLNNYLISSPKLASSNLSETIGVEFDLNNETLKLGGSNASFNNTGIFIGKDNGLYKLSLKSSSGDSLSWDGNGHLSLTGEIDSDAGLIGGWTIDSTGINKSLVSGHLYIVNDHSALPDNKAGLKAIGQVDSTFTGLRFYSNDAATVLSMGSNSNYTYFTIYNNFRKIIFGEDPFVSGNFGFRITDDAGNDLIKFMDDVNTIAGWNVDGNYLYSGSKQVNNDFTTNGITIGNNAFRSENFRIDTDGSAYFKGDLSIDILPDDPGMNGLEYYFSFDQQDFSADTIIYDETGNNNLTVVGNYASVATGVSRNGIKMTGAGKVSGAYLEFDNEFTIDTLSSSVSFWLKFDNTDFTVKTLYRILHGYGLYNFLDIGHNQDGRLMFLGETNVNMEFYVNNTVTDVLVDNEWHHYTLNFEDNDTKVYYDGILVAEKSGVGTSFTGIILRGIGNKGDGDNYGDYLNGCIDEVRFYNRPLHEREIKYLYKNKTSSLGTVIDGNTIKTGTIKSNNYNYSSGIYSTAGTSFNLNTGEILSPNFSLSSDGSAYFNGKITATDGNIANWIIEEDFITSDEVSGYHEFNMNLYSGTSKNTGSFYSGAGLLQGLSISWHQTGNAGFMVIGQMAETINTAKEGYYGIQLKDYQNNEYFALGANTALSGAKSFYNRIAGFTFDAESLYTNGKTQYNDTSSGIHIGNDGIGVGNNIFTVSPTGELVATNANISGTINSVSGNIGGWDIGSSITSLDPDTNNNGVVLAPYGVGVYPEAGIVKISGGFSSIFVGDKIILSGQTETDTFETPEADKIKVVASDNSIYIGSSITLNGNSSGIINIGQSFILDGADGGELTISTNEGILRATGAGIWLGDGKFDDAPFSVNSSGYITAFSGNIGGWDIGSSITSLDPDTNNNGVVLAPYGVGVAPEAGIVKISGGFSSIFVGDKIILSGQTETDTFETPEADKIKVVASKNSIYVGSSISLNGTGNGEILIGNNGNILRANSLGIWLGASKFVDAPFSVNSSGYITASSGNIGGWIFDSNDFSAVSGSSSITGGTIRTAETGNRVELSSANNSLSIYNNSSVFQLKPYSSSAEFAQFTGGASSGTTKGLVIGNDTSGDYVGLGYRTAQGGFIMLQKNGYNSVTLENNTNGLSINKGLTVSDKIINEDLLKPVFFGISDGNGNKEITITAVKLNGDASDHKRVAIKWWISDTNFGAPTEINNLDYATMITGTHIEGDLVRFNKCNIGLTDDNAGNAIIKISFINSSSSNATGYIMAEIQGIVYSSGSVTFHHPGADLPLPD